MVIVNICFWIMAVMRYIEINKISTSTEALISNPVQSSIVVLGFIAIAVNFLFLLICSIKKMTGKTLDISKWTMAFHIVTFFAQLSYHFG
jgi:hypothetical protein